MKDKPKFVFAPDEVFMKPDVMAKRADVSPDTPNLWRRRRVGPPFVVMVGGIRYPLSWFLQWSADNTWKPDGWTWPNVRGISDTVRSARGSRLAGKKRVRV
jgi:hypothetical protein